MSPVWRSLRYLLAFLLTFLSAMIFLLLRSTLGAAIVSQLFLLPVGISAVLWGLGPSVMAAVVSFLLYNYLFLAPHYSLVVHNSRDLVSLFVFLVVAVVISQLIGQTREKSDLATHRELEAMRLYELSNTLAGYHDPGMVLEKLAELVQETLQARRVEVVLDTQAEGNPVQYVATHFHQGIDPDTERPSEDPDVLIPLQAAQSVIGEMRVWLQQQDVVHFDYRRFLEVCSAQASLALERIRLRDLDTRARILEESDRLKTALLSSVSHELRTPLSTIKASVSSLRDEGFIWDSKARKDLLAAVEEETDHLNQLVGNLLSMSRIEAGALQPERKWNDLREIVERVLSKMKLQSHPIDVDVSGELPMVDVDFILMDQVFSNLISNSVKFSPENSVISISASQSDGLIYVRLTNQGPPVPEEHLGRIFDKFHRITLTDKVTGTGLGLSICKGIVEAHGGKIWAENSPQGFSFVFTIPLKGERAILPDLQE